MIYNGEKIEEKAVEAQNIRPTRDSLKGVKLVEQVLAARDDTRLSLHVMHGTVSLH